MGEGREQRQTNTSVESMRCKEKKIVVSRDPSQVLIVTYECLVTFQISTTSFEKCTSCTESEGNRSVFSQRRATATQSE